MASRGVRRSRGEEEQESYFVSMADMMVGLLFVFIILLLYSRCSSARPPRTCRAPSRAAPRSSNASTSSCAITASR